MNVTTSKDILQNLTQKLKVALDEVNQIKDSLLTAPEMERMKEGFQRGAKVVGDEASRVFEELGRETYKLVKAGKLSVPEAIRDTFEWAEKNLARFAEEPATPPAENAAPPAEPAPVDVAASSPEASGATPTDVAGQEEPVPAPEGEASTPEAVQAVVEDEEKKG